MSFSEYDNLQLPVLKVSDVSFILIDVNACIVHSSESPNSYSLQPWSQLGASASHRGWLDQITSWKILVNYRSLRLRRELSFQTSWTPPLPRLTEDASQPPICGISGTLSPPCNLMWLSCSLACLIIQVVRKSPNPAGIPSCQHLFISLFKGSTCFDLQASPR